MKKTILTILLLMLAGIMSANTVRFATPRLKSIARSLRLDHMDLLGEGEHYQYRYQGHDLDIRVNDVGEIEHIGLLLFPRWCRQDGRGILYDFLERNLLERQISNLDEKLWFKLQTEKLFFLKGSAQTAMQIDTTGISSFETSHEEFKTYMVCWKHEGVELLKIKFDMDYQMISGCDALELDSLFMQRLKRFKPHEYTKREVVFPQDKDTYIVKGDTFIINEFRNELYYERRNGDWHLADSMGTLNETLRNMMLSMDFGGEPVLTVSLDRHSDVKYMLQIPYKYWMQMCLDEGCKPFFGIKRKTETSYEGTVLMANPSAGYVHLLSVVVPLETLEKGGNGPIRGYLFVYIPMHNVSNEYLQT